MLLKRYTAVPWSSDGRHKRDATAFLFNNRTDATCITAFPIKRGAPAVYHLSFSGPYFGELTDLLLLYSGVGDCRSKGDSYKFDGYELTGASKYHFGRRQMELCD